MEFKIEPYLFCEQELSPYEKTIYILAIAYGSAPIYELKKEHVQELAYFLDVDFELLYKAVENEVNFPYKSAVIKFGNDTVACGDYFDNTFFNVIIKVFFMYKNLDELFEGTDDEEIRENIRVFNAVTHLFDTANAIAATYECMHKNAFSYDNTMYDSAECFCPKNYINMLILFLSSKDCLGYEQGLLMIITEILKYEFITRLNALYLVTICQMLKHSPCFTDDIKGIATDIYNKLLHILKNGKIIATRINILYNDIAKPFCERTKSDNTTRMQILYGYSNYDCYELRFDFAHMGQEFVHFNNETPGGLSCCIFTKEEYQTIVNKHPELKECFISYNDQWALKERSNCDLSSGLSALYEEICKSKAHDPIFSCSYSEDEINEFVNIMARMLPKEFRGPIDTTGDYAKHCFNYDIIMRNTTILYLSYLENNKEYVQMLYTDISDKAFKYGLISKDESEKINSFEAVLQIIKKAKERIS